MAFDITPLDPAAFSAEYRQQFQELGYVRIPGFINADEVAVIHENLQRLIIDIVPGLAATDVFYEDKADKTSIKQIIRVFHHDDFFAQLFLRSDQWGPINGVRPSSVVFGSPHPLLPPGLSPWHENSASHIPAHSTM